MTFLSQAFFCVMVFVIGGIGFVFTMKLMAGKIQTKGILRNKETGKLSPERMQALGFSFFVALYYLTHLKTTAPYFPEIPQELFWLLGSSHAGYLGIKAHIFGHKKGGSNGQTV